MYVATNIDLITNIQLFLQNVSHKYITLQQKRIWEEFAFSLIKTTRAKKKTMQELPCVRFRMFYLHDSQNKTLRVWSFQNNASSGEVKKEKLLTF